MKKEKIETTMEDVEIVIIDEGINRDEEIARSCCFGPVAPIMPE